MSLGVEALFTSAQALQLPRAAGHVKRDADKRGIDCASSWRGAAFALFAYGLGAQPVHLRRSRRWRSPACFEREARLHRVLRPTACEVSGKTTHVTRPRPSSGFTVALEGFALAFCCAKPVHQAVQFLPCTHKHPPSPMEFYAYKDRALKRSAGLRILGIDETSFRRGQSGITVAKELDSNRRLNGREGPHHQIVLDSVADVEVAFGRVNSVKRVGVDKNAACTQGVGLTLLEVPIRYDRPHFISPCNEGFDIARHAEMPKAAGSVRAAMCPLHCKTHEQPMSGMPPRPCRLEPAVFAAIHAQRRASIPTEESAAAGKCQHASEQRTHTSATSTVRLPGPGATKRIESFKLLATLRQGQLDDPVNGSLAYNSTPFVDWAANVQMQQETRTNKSAPTSAAFLAVSCLRMPKMTRLPASRICLVCAW